MFDFNLFRKHPKHVMVTVIKASWVARICAHSLFGCVVSYHSGLSSTLTLLLQILCLTDGYGSAIAMVNKLTVFVRLNWQDLVLFLIYVWVDGSTPSYFLKSWMMSHRPQYVYAINWRTIKGKKWISNQFQLHCTWLYVHHMFQKARKRTKSQWLYTTSTNYHSPDNSIYILVLT